MDPTVAIREMEQALGRGDYGSLREHAESLLDWIGCGGFVPGGYSADRLLSRCSDLRAFAIQRGA